jgi:potassium inwardly-rectifying channel subfamily J
MESDHWKYKSIDSCNGLKDEKKPILKSLLDMDSYLTTSADSAEAVVIDQNFEDRSHTPLSDPFRKFKENWPFKYFVKKTKVPTYNSRIVDRDCKFHQSNGKLAIKKKIGGEDWRALYSGDLFHSLLDAPSARSIGILLTGYMLLVVLFSIPYYHISRTYGCDLGIDSYQEAFAFSLETMATIGYGTQDIFFDNCWSPIFVLACQISCKLIADAVIIGVIYSRFGRPNTRASTILFSNHAVIRRISGKLYFMFQLVELRKHQLIEAQVRLYVIKKDIDPPDINEFDREAKDDIDNGSSSPKSTGGKMDVKKSITNFQTCKMRLNFPNDELGGMLIMCLPQVVVHEIDAGSPLMPPPLWRSCENPRKCYQWDSKAFDDSNDVKYPNVVKRSESLSTVSQSSNQNGNFSSRLNSPEKVNNSGVNNLNGALDDEISDTSPAGYVSPADIEKDRIQKEKDMISFYMQDRKMEIFAIVEGIDATTGGVVQARHSFIHSEIEWDKSFTPCVFEDKQDGSAVIDFSVFHDLIDVSTNANHSGPMQSHT